MGTLDQKTFTAANTTWSSYDDIDLPNVGRNFNTQVISVSAISDASGGTGTLTFILYDTSDPVDPVKRRYDATLTTGTTRTDAAGTGGGYLMNVSFAASSNQNQDIMPGDAGPKMEWRWDLSAIGGSATAIKVLLAYDEVI